jgi:hypothetical protein
MEAAEDALQRVLLGLVEAVDLVDFTARDERPRTVCPA